LNPTGGATDPGCYRQKDGMWRERWGLVLGSGCRVMGVDRPVRTGLGVWALSPTISIGGTGFVIIKIFCGRPELADGTLAHTDIIQE